MTYNMTPIYDGNTTLEIIDGFVKVAGGTGLFNMLILFIYIAILIVYGRENLGRVSIAASFITGVISVLFYALGWLNQSILILPIILLMISLLIYKFTE